MDQLVAMRAFVKVVQMGNFSQAAKDGQSSQANMSKRVAALETRLGVKLLTRSSRNLTLTEVGSSYYQKCLTILTQLDEADAQVQSDKMGPRGKLKVALPITFSRLVLAPIINKFIERFPEINVEFVVSDVHADLIAQGIDVAIRGKTLEDSSLVARPLYNNPLSLVASKEYLKKFGTPKHPQELAQHNFILHSQALATPKAIFSLNGKKTAVTVTGKFQSNNGETNLEVALSGLGIVGLATWSIQSELAAGKLVEILTEYDPLYIPINAIYPRSDFVPLKVKCFIDFVKEEIKNNPIFS